MSDAVSADLRPEKSKTLQRLEGWASEAELLFPKQTVLEEQIEFPDDLSETQDAELSNLMGKYAALIAYAQFVLGQAKIEQVSRKAQYDIERAKLYMTYRRDDRMTEKEREAAIELSNVMIPIKFQLVQSEAYVTLLEALLNGYTAKYNVLSRELTRKGFRTDRGY